MTLRIWPYCAVCADTQLADGSRSVRTIMLVATVCPCDCDTDVALLRRLCGHTVGGWISQRENDHAGRNRMSLRVYTICRNDFLIQCHRLRCALFPRKLTRPLDPQLA